MSRLDGTALRWVGMVIFCSFIYGCTGTGRSTDGGRLKSLDADLGKPIGSLVEVFGFSSVPVEGYALVGGLRGTGSSKCPPAIRKYLEKYIMRQLSGQKNVGKFIDDRDTAVVRVESHLPAVASKNQRFDIRLRALANTGTTSLENGHLLGAELKAAGMFSVTFKILATAQGPVFIDKISTGKPDKNVAYILGGGRVLNEYRIALALFEPDFRTASLIRDRLNTQFGTGTAKAPFPEQIELSVPAKYKVQKQKFISLVKAMYLVQTPELTKRRILALVRKLAISDDKQASEVALEAIGRESIEQVAALLNFSDEEVQFRAARCILNLGSDHGLETLRQIALNTSSAYRIQALQAIGVSARRSDAATISQTLLQDDDFDVRFAAYKILRKLDDISVSKTLVANDFYLEKVAPVKHRTVYVARSGQPRIVLFGAPISCRKDTFVRSDDGTISINALPGQKRLSIIRQVPDIPPVQLESSFELSDIIRTMCEEPVRKTTQSPLGLGISYSDVIAILKRMSEKGSINADFRASRPPEIGLKE